MTVPPLWPSSFSLAVIVGEQSFSPVGAAIGFIKIGAAWAVVGILIGLTTAAWVKRVFNDPEIEIAVILVGAYLTFYAAEAFLGVSGVLGLVALGVVMASFGRTRISPKWSISSMSSSSSPPSFVMC